VAKATKRVPRGKPADAARMARHNTSRAKED